MGRTEEQAKQDALKLIEELVSELQTLNENDRIAEFDQFAVVRSDSGIITVVAFESGESYEFMSINTAAEFIVMNAGKFIGEDEE